MLEDIDLEMDRLCNATKVILDVSKLTPVNCPLYRPGYLCDEPATFYHYAPGAFSLAQPCTKHDAFKIGKFPADHLRDIFDSFECKPHPVVPTTKLDGVTLLVTREKGEHFNLFHAATDWLNAFAVIAILARQATARLSSFLDEHAPSNLDLVWDIVFSRKRATRRISNVTTPILVEHAVFVPPGYSSFLYKDISDGLTCDPRLESREGKLSHVGSSIFFWLSGSLMKSGYFSINSLDVNSITKRRSSPL